MVVADLIHPRRRLCQISHGLNENEVNVGVQEKKKKVRKLRVLCSPGLKLEVMLSALRNTSVEIIRVGARLANSVPPVY